jgi:2-hydroxy-3-keto-5-methylthiopentenyl-1-phosphate phosphatase
MTDNKNNTKQFVFCDFDGTITSEESLERVFERFTPTIYEPIKQKMMSLEITIREGVRQLLETIPSARYPELLEFVKDIPIRPGLEELLNFLDAGNIPFVIISGGLRGMIDARLGRLADRVYKIFSADVDTSGEFIKVTSDFEGGMELVAKVDVMNLFGDGRRIVIGDGATDINMARGASLIFARDNLAFFLDHMGISYNEWSDFFDIRNALQAVQHL